MSVAAGYHITEAVHSGCLEARTGAIVLPPCCDFEKTTFVGVSVAAAAAKSLQSHPTLCDPVDGSPLGSSVPGILQARTLEWVAISFSNA